MTGYTVHTGSSEDFAAGWDRVFSDEKKKGKKPKAKAASAKSKAKSKKAKKK